MKTLEQVRIYPQYQEKISADEFEFFTDPDHWTTYIDGKDFTITMWVNFYQDMENVFQFDYEIFFEDFSETIMKKSMADCLDFFIELRDKINSPPEEEFPTDRDLTSFETFQKELRRLWP